jgi:signal recognition particle subunit SRP19
VENPTIQEMSECLEHLKIHHVVELDKAYPKEWYNPGRIKVYIKNKEGQLFNS